MNTNLVLIKENGTTHYLEALSAEAAAPHTVTEAVDAANVLNTLFSNRLNYASLFPMIKPALLGNVSFPESGGDVYRRIMEPEQAQAMLDSFVGTPHPAVVVTIDADAGQLRFQHNAHIPDAPEDMEISFEDAKRCLRTARDSALYAPDAEHFERIGAEMLKECRDLGEQQSGPHMSY